MQIVIFFFFFSFPLSTFSTIAELCCWCAQGDVTCCYPQRHATSNCFQKPFPMILGRSRSSFAVRLPNRSRFLTPIILWVIITCASWHHKKSKNRQRTRWRTVLINMASSPCLLIFLKCRKDTPNFFKAIIFACWRMFLDIFWFHGSATLESSLSKNFKLI